LGLNLAVSMPLARNSDTLTINFNKNDHFQDYLPAREENAELLPHEEAQIAICPGKQPKGLDPSQLVAQRKPIW